MSFYKPGVFDRQTFNGFPLERPVVNRRNATLFLVESLRFTPSFLDEDGHQPAYRLPLPFVFQRRRQEQELVLYSEVLMTSM